MAKCGFCNSSILLGGISAGNEKFCNNQCLQSQRVVYYSRMIPPDVIRQEIERVHAGNCPQCQRMGPVDVHISHRIWSAFVLTQWSSKSKICCHSCGTKNKVLDTAFCLFLGWWGFPWGILGTPIQIGRNVVGIFTAPNGARPSPMLEKFITSNLAANIAQNQQSPPPLPSA